MSTVIQIDAAALIAASAAIGGGVATGLKLGLGAIANAMRETNTVVREAMRVMGRTEGMVDLVEERSGVYEVPPEIVALAPITPTTSSPGYRPPIRPKTEPGRGR